MREKGGGGAGGEGEREGGRERATSFVSSPACVCRHTHTQGGKELPASCTQVCLHTTPDLIGQPQFSPHIITSYYIATAVASYSFILCHSILHIFLFSTPMHRTARTTVKHFVVGRLVEQPLAASCYYIIFIIFIIFIILYFCLVLRYAGCTRWLVGSSLAAPVRDERHYLYILIY